MLHRDAAIRAALCAVVIPVAFFVAQYPLGGGQVSLFASFGGFALLVFADFPGDRSARAASYVALGLAGAALIALGSLCASPSWLAVVAMLVVGTGVLFVGVLSAALAGASRAALLTFILPVTIPGGPADIPERLGGWLLASLVCVPTALFLFPQGERRRSRRDAAVLCRSLADLLAGLLRGVSASSSDDELRSRVERQLEQLRSQFDSDVTRPVGLNAGSRALVRVVLELEWLASLVMDVETGDADRWEPAIREATMTSAAVLAVCGSMLEPAAGGPEPDDLDELLERSTSQGRVAFDTTVESILDGSRVAPSFRPHEIATTTALVGHTIAWAAAADARSPVDRLLGTGLPTVEPESRLLGEVPALRSSALSYVTGRSVWFRNSIRGGVGLAIAVLFAVSFDVQHGFWVVLGVLSVLRSNAVSTGSTAVRAVIGTVVGCGIGAVVILVLGTGPVALSIVLPIAVFIASYAPAAMSFAAGQAAFTLVVLILFNLIEPVGWKIGVTRVEDVALGCLISLVVGLVFWPRGATAAVESALLTARQAGSDYFRRAVDVATTSAPIPAERAREAVVAGRLLDDALRQFQVELGQNRSCLAQMITRAGDATRLRLAADAICSLGVESDGTRGLLPATRHVLAEHAAHVTAMFSASGSTTDTAEERDVGRSVASALRAEVDPNPGLGELPRRLLWAAMYVHDVERQSGHGHA
jgi:Fusaric acid resistance protein-like